MLRMLCAKSRRGSSLTFGMNRAARTFLAFLIAPLAAPLVFSTFAASVRPPEEGPSWAASFGMNLTVSALSSYAVSMTAGLFTFVVLRALRRETVVCYTAVGASVALVWALTIIGAGASGSVFSLFLFAGVFAALGSMVAAAFAMIRGVPLQNPPRS